MNAHELIESYVDDVVSHLGRRRRNDVGWELRALLADELKAQSEAAGREPDQAMVMVLLRRFGAPEEVAARYRKPGFPVIDAAEAPTFVWLTAIGMAAIWITGIVVTFHDDGLERLTYWWMTWGLGAFWWPGFLVVCMGIAGWVRRRLRVPGEWSPRVIDRERVSRLGWSLAIVFFALGTIWLTAPAQILERLTGGRLAAEFYAHYVYDETFRQWRLPLLLTLLTVHILLYAVLVAHGRWRRLTRRLDIALSAVICALLVRSIAAGRIFASEISNEIAEAVIALIVLWVIGDIAATVYREYRRVRVPASLQ